VAVREHKRSDGRTARAERTRAAVVDALLGLIDEGRPQPSAHEVAERAGVSLRIVYHHFDDVAALFTAAAARNSERVLAGLVPIEAGRPFGERLDAFVAQRSTLYERIFNVRRASRLVEHAAPLVAKTLDFVRAAKRVEAERVFGRELEALPRSLGRDRAAALGTVASFATWESLRAHQQLTVEDARRVWRGIIAAVLKET
jgi:TetR/AcrR family transcriptional regulator, regulator of autoinduction and epiphytic fitness